MPFFFDYSANLLVPIMIHLSHWLCRLYNSIIRLGGTRLLLDTRLLSEVLRYCSIGPMLIFCSMQGTRWRSWAPIMTASFSFYFQPRGRGADS